MKKVLLAFALLVMAYKAEAQVGIGTEEPSPSSLLDIVAQDRGILIPRVHLTSTTDATTINGGNVESLLLYNYTAADIPIGYYYWHNNRWNRLVSDAELSEPSPMPEFKETRTQLEDNSDGSFIYINENGEIDAVTVDYSQELGPFVLTGNTLELSLEKGGTASVDLSELVGAASGSPAPGENLEAGDASVIIENGEGATLVAASVSVAEEGITTGKIAPKAVSPEKLSAAAEDAGKVATVQEDGSVSYEAIKAAMPKFFYMPSILVPVRERQVDTRYDAQDRLGRINLHARYQEQFGNPMASSENAVASIPTLPATELEFHVTYFDERVFQVDRITADGILHYTVKDAPLTEVSFMNIVFVIK